MENMSQKVHRKIPELAGCSVLVGTSPWNEGNDLCFMLHIRIERKSKSFAMWIKAYPDIIFIPLIRYEEVRKKLPNVGQAFMKAMSTMYPGGYTSLTEVAFR